jgi:hypothetical protein
MKIAKIINKKYSLLKLHLLKYQVYKKINDHSLSNSMENQEINLKKILKIIYLYHTNNKKIMFVGFPYSRSLIKSSSHTFLPKISRSIYVSNKLLNEFDLIIFYNQNDKDSVILKGLCNLGIPLIFVGNSDILNRNLLHFYTSVFLISSKKFKRFWFFLVFSILKKPAKN